nr:MAG TPA: zinc-ribbon domain protein [Bacteriophage sp.]
MPRCQISLHVFTSQLINEAYELICSTCKINFSLSYQL